MDWRHLGLPVVVSVVVSVAVSGCTESAPGAFPSATGGGEAFTPSLISDLLISTKGQLFHAIAGPNDTVLCTQAGERAQNPPVISSYDLNAIQQSSISLSLGYHSPYLVRTRDGTIYVSGVNGEGSDNFHGRIAAVSPANGTQDIYVEFDLELDDWIGGLALTASDELVVVGGNANLRSGWLRHIRDGQEVAFCTGWPGMLFDVASEGANVYVYGRTQDQAFVSASSLDCVISWTNYLPGQSGQVVISQPDAGVVAAYGNRPSETESQELSLVRYRPDGSVVWSESSASYGHAPTPAQLLAVDGGFVVAGSGYFDTGDVDFEGLPILRKNAFVAQVDGAGASLWEDWYGSTERHEGALDALLTESGDLVTLVLKQAIGRRDYDRLDVREAWTQIPRRRR